MKNFRSSSRSIRESGRALTWAVFVLTAAAAIAVAMLLNNIRQRKAEAQMVAFPLVKLTEKTVDPVEWGKNFPRQYDGYIRTVDIERTKYGGSEAFEHLDQDPAWRTIFAGYAFAIDYREERGHAYMLTDQRETERVKQKKQPGACMQCHASNVVAYREVGLSKGAPGSLDDSLTGDNGMAQLFKGFETVCAMDFADATKLVSHPVSCLDCHNPETMKLRVSRPGFITGIRALAKSDAPTPHLPSIERWRHGDRKREYDPNIDASRQELRSMACGQCHVEYYFKGEGKVVTYPWDNGLKVEQIEKYYDDQKFKDWTHATTGAPVLKAQHPEFETWSQGIHARSGVACADCHMPYTREGALKISDHHVRSPMLNISRACQTCHNYPESEILSRVEAIQDRSRQLLDRGEAALVDLIRNLESAKASGASEEQLNIARTYQRSAQWRLDFVSAENSMGFHAPQETARILAEAIDFARRGQVQLMESVGVEAVKKVIPDPPIKSDAKPPAKDDAHH